MIQIPQIVELEDIENKEKNKEFSLKKQGEHQVKRVCLPGDSSLHFSFTAGPSSMRAGFHPL